MVRGTSKKNNSKKYSRQTIGRIKMVSIYIGVTLNLYKIYDRKSENINLPHDVVSKVYWISFKKWFKKKDRYNDI